MCLCSQHPGPVPRFKYALLGDNRAMNRAPYFSQLMVNINLYSQAQIFNVRSVYHGEVVQPVEVAELKSLELKVCSGSDSGYGRKKYIFSLEAKLPKGLHSYKLNMWLFDWMNAV